MKTAVITVSTSVAAGRSEDRSGEALSELAGAAGADVVARELVSDDQDAIERALRTFNAAAPAFAEGTGAHDTAH